jgi:alkylated DNA repair dioxygenase AlkB
MKQMKLFGNLQKLPPGLLYKPEFITRDEEMLLLVEIGKLPLHAAKYKDYTAKRRIMIYGAAYDFSNNELIPAGPIPTFLYGLHEQISLWSGIPGPRFTHALIAEYKIGTQLGWHRDVPDFETVVGVSLGGLCRMRLRRYPPQKGRTIENLHIDLEARSAYLMREESRWGWQHSIPPTKTTRYSITFRTLVGGGIRKAQGP